MHELAGFFRGEFERTVKQIPFCVTEACLLLRGVVVVMVMGVTHPSPSVVSDAGCSLGARELMLGKGPCRNGCITKRGRGGTCSRLSR